MSTLTWILVICFALMGMAQKNNERKRKQARRMRQQESETGEEQQRPESILREILQQIEQEKKVSGQGPKEVSPIPAEDRPMPFRPEPEIQKPTVSKKPVIEHVETDSRSLETIFSEIDERPDYRTNVNINKGKKKISPATKPAKKSDKNILQETQSPTVDFDLREAVIYSEILKPKFQD